jgi:hypothetical protein
MGAESHAPPWPNTWFLTRRIISQNILQAIRLLASNVNEAKMIANQIKSLAHEVQNLKKASIRYYF